MAVCLNMSQKTKIFPSKPLMFCDEKVAKKMQKN